MVRDGSIDRKVTEHSCWGPDSSSDRWADERGKSLKGLIGELS
jgi:hypothetical protein